MQLETTPPVNHFRNTAKFCAMAVLAIGTLVLVGWIFKIPILKSGFTGFVEMKANTAVCFIFGGISLWCLSQESRSKLTSNLGLLAALFITVVGGVTLAQYLFKIDLGIDLLLFNESHTAVATSHPGRMALTTAISLVLKGIALLTVDWETKRGHRPSQFLSILTGLFPIQALIAYSFGLRTVFGEGEQFVLVTQMAIPAALALLLLSVGTLFAVPDRGMMQLASNDSYAGSTLRRMFIPALIIPFFLAYLVLAGYRHEFYDAGFGFATLALGSLSLYGVLAWWNAHKLMLMEKAHSEELKKSEEQVRHLQKMDAIGRLASGVAHDFNNILAIIGLYSESLFEGLKPTDPMRANAEQVTKAVQKGAVLTKQLLAFSRQQVVKPKLLQLDQVVTDFRDMLNRLIGENIELITDLDKNTAPVLADLGQIEQVIINLAVNARDAMPNGGRLIISTQTVNISKKLVGNKLEIAPGTYALLNITDTGVGMSAETRDQIFEPFFTTKAIGKGTGLGLSTVYGVVKKHNGSVWVYSELGQGTSFKIYLPSVGNEAPRPVQVTKHDDSLLQNKTILIAEDELDLRDVLCSALENQGFKVIRAADGADALQKVVENKGKIDLIISDVMMPRMTGPELAKAVTERWPQIKVLFLSGYVGDMFQRQGGYLDKNTYFLEKPFLSQDLVLKARDIFINQ